jgi:hypothetical protein
VPAPATFGWQTCSDPTKALCLYNGGGRNASIFPVSGCEAESGVTCVLDCEPEPEPEPWGPQPLCDESPGLAGINCGVQVNGKECAACVRDDQPVDRCYWQVWNAYCVPSCSQCPVGA